MKLFLFVIAIFIFTSVVVGGILPDFIMDYFEIGAENRQIVEYGCLIVVPIVVVTIAQIVYKRKQRVQSDFQSDNNAN
jgi:hypothetical protein